MLAAAFAALTAAAAAYAAAITERATALCPDGVHRASNLQCCKWFQIRDDLINEVFENTCGENAHSTVRIAFHDAIGFSTTNARMGGGADGSIIAFPQELDFAANNGISDIVGDLHPFADERGISYGDVIHFGSSVALSLCPGAPVVQTFVGRQNATRPAIDGTVPDPFNTIVAIRARMADAGFKDLNDLVSLLASHSIAAQDKQDESIGGSPFDSTPGIFDSQFFLEVQMRGILFPGAQDHQGEVESPMHGEFRLQSDHLLARDSSTSCLWQSFVTNQALMASSFATQMAKLDTLGLNRNSLIDCTEVIPQAPPAPRKAAYFPSGKSYSDIEQACATALFPKTLSTQAGAATAVPPVPPQ